MALQREGEFGGRHLAVGGVVGERRAPRHGHDDRPCAKELLDLGEGRLEDLGGEVVKHRAALAAVVVLEQDAVRHEERHARGVVVDRTTEPHGLEPVRDVESLGPRQDHVLQRVVVGGEICVSRIRAPSVGFDAADLDGIETLAVVAANACEHLAIELDSAVLAAPRADVADEQRALVGILFARDVAEVFEPQGQEPGFTRQLVEHHVFVACGSHLSAEGGDGLVREVVVRREPPALGVPPRLDTLAQLTASEERLTRLSEFGVESIACFVHVRPPGVCQ